MVDKSHLLYGGSDLSPVVDYTEEEWTDWAQTELAMAADGGDSTESTWLVRDEAGVIPDRRGGPQLGAHNVVITTVGSNTLFRGRVEYQDRKRGRQFAQTGGGLTKGRAGEWTVTLSDANSHLSGIIVHDWTRPAETDVARVQALVAAYLSGNPRATTNLNGSNLVHGSNTTTLPAKTYSGVTPGEVLSEIAELTDKEMFVTVDNELAYFGHDYTGYASTLRISDDPANLNATTCVPIEPSRAENGRDTLTALRTYWGGTTEGTEHTFQRVDETRAAINDYWEDVNFDSDSKTFAEASQRATSIFAPRKLDQTTYTVTIGAPGTLPHATVDADGHTGWAGQPMRGDDIYKLKAGQLIEFKSHGARGGIDDDGSQIADFFLTRRIREVRWTFGGVDAYFCTLKLDRPRPTGNGRGGGAGQPAGTSPTPKPICDPEPDSLALDADWDWSACSNPSYSDFYGLHAPNPGNPWGSGFNSGFGSYGGSGCATTVNYNVYSKNIPVVGGGTIVVSIRSAVYGGSGRDVNLTAFWGTGTEHNSGSTIKVVRAGFWSHEGGDHGAWTDQTVQYDVPSGVDGVTFKFIAAGFIQNFSVGVPVVGASCPVDSIPSDPGGGTDAHYARYDDPRFTADDQHVTSRISRVMTNGSGSDLEVGAAVIADGQDAFILPPATLAYDDGMVGYLREDVADGATGIVQWIGISSTIIPVFDGAAAVDDFIYTSATPGQVTSDPVRSTGAIGKVIEVDADDVPTMVEWWGVPDTSGTLTVQENDSTVDAAVTVLDFGNGLDVTSSPAGEANIVVDPSEIKLDDLGTPDDNTDLNASSARHGLLRKLDNTGNLFLRDDGTWAPLTSVAETALGYMAFAVPSGVSIIDGTGVYTAASLPANGGSRAFSIELTAPMLLDTVLVRCTDTATARSIRVDVYYQASSTTTDGTRVASGTLDFTPSGASTRAVSITSAPVLVAPGLYWVVIQNTHATNTFGLGVKANGGAFAAVNAGESKTTSNPNGATLDMSTGWTRLTSVGGLVLQGRVFNEGAAF